MVRSISINDITIIIPPLSPEIEIEEQSESGLNYYLAIMDPFSYVLRGAKQAKMDIKTYVFRTLQEPQSSYLPNPKGTVRYEHLYNDLKQLGIHTDTTFFPPEGDMCLSTRAMVRRLYKNDFILGDYI